ncbi:MAG: glutamate N-acetyltransferase/amino-acid N-acetyltransferase [Candidatus Azotimanducaceae bacterium]|jgi:glutamate N-acetyltransferase/amino-acid N-acetyltransferase
MAIGEGNRDFKVVPGVKLSSLSCGIKGDGIADLVLFEFAEGTQTAGVFTQSIFAAAPVLLGKKHLDQAASRYFLINSGNANAGVGEEGLSDALTCCKSLSQLTGVRPESILPFSTGVIGERLPVSNIINALDDALKNLSEENWLVAAEGIMTTDTRPKISSRQITIDGKTITLTGMAKGSGMIQPNMATLLSYIATDAKIDQALLKIMLIDASNKSFNRVTVDSDTSTNDSFMLSATGLSGVEIDNSNQEKFVEALESLSVELAHGIIRDAEGATKFIAVKVSGGKCREDCLAIAYSIANSPLMKTALFASDANWGRIVMAIGKAGVAVDINKLDVYLGDVQLMLKGQKHPNYTEVMGAEIVAKEEIQISVCLHSGDFEETVWTSDLSTEYVRINAEYRT